MANRRVQIERVCRQFFTLKFIYMNYSKSRLLYGIFIVLAFGCSSQKEPTGVWVNGDKVKEKSFTKVFIVAVTPDIEVRTKLENALATAIAAKGYQVVKSVDSIPFSLSDPKIPTKEQVIEKVRSSGSDAVFLTALVKKDASVGYTPGQTAYAPMPYMNYYGGYYSYLTPTVSTSGYYSYEKNYVVQTNLYDAASEEIMWSAQSAVLNPSSIEEFSKKYMSTLVGQLKKAKVLKTDAGKK
jgi:hypothetical protein